MIGTRLEKSTWKTSVFFLFTSSTSPHSVIQNKFNAEYGPKAKTNAYEGKLETDEDRRAA